MRRLICAVTTAALLAALAACGPPAAEVTTRTPPSRSSAAPDIRVVADQFAVEGQHNWVRFPIAAPPGDHLLTVTSDSGGRLYQRFTLPEKGLRYAAINYWYHPGGKEGRYFSWQVQSEPMAFD